MSSHPISRAQPKISSSAPADALSELSEAGLLHVSCQLYSCLYVPGWQLFLIFSFQTIFPTHVHTCDPTQAARFYSEGVLPRHLLTSADDLAVFFTNKQC